jgi:hypothetical protein
MADPIRIVGHTNKDGSSNDGLQAQVETDGSLRVDLLSRYKISDIDESGSPAYYGFVDTDGYWYIMSVTTTAVRYDKGTSGYAIAWAARNLGSYDYYYTVF